MSRHASFGVAARVAGPILEPLGGLPRSQGHPQVRPGSLILVENVGNLVCTALFDLGENSRVVIISVTDKPLKYPYMFAAADLVVINKADLLPYVGFDVEQCVAYARSVNPDVRVLTVSATTGEGMEHWYDWLAGQYRDQHSVPVTG